MNRPPRRRFAPSRASQPGLRGTASHARSGDPLPAAEREQDPFQSAVDAPRDPLAPHPPVIRGMRESDLDEVVAIDALSRLTPWSRRSFLEEMKNPLSYCFTLKRRNDPSDHTIGFLCFRIVGEESEVLALAVHPQHRRLGLGRQLMGFYIEFCSRRKVQVCYLETNASNQAAIDLYRSFSYRVIGVRPKYYREKEDALLMARRA